MTTTHHLPYSLRFLLGTCAALASGCYQNDGSRLMDDGGSSSDDGAAPTDTDDGDDDDGGSDDGSTSDGDVDPPAPGMVKIRVIHGSPGAPAVDVYIAGEASPVIAGLDYTETSSWLEVPAGTYAFDIRAAAAAPSDAPAYSTGNLELPEGAMVSALAAGVLPAGPDAPVPSGSAFRVIPIVEAFDAANPGKARVRVVHAGSDAPEVGLDVGNDGVIEVDGLARFGDTGAAGVLLPAGDALSLGITADGERVTAFELPALADGGNVLIVATGLLGRLPRETQGFGLLAINDTGTIGFIKQNPTVYALHAGPDAPEVDLCVGNDAIATHLEFGEMQAAQVPPGDYTIDAFVAPSGCAGTPAMSDVVEGLVAGERYLVVATGELSPVMGEPPLQLQAYADRFALDQPAMAALQLVHAASAPEVDVGIVTGDVIENGNLISPDLKWPATSAELMVQPLTYQIGFAAAGTPTPIHPLVDFHVPADSGARAFVVAAGDLLPESTEAGFRLLVVDTSSSPWQIGSILPNP